MIVSNKIWKQIIRSEGKDQQLIDDLRIALVTNPEASKLFVILEYIKQLTKEEKSIRILDFGCGSGQLLTYLRILGYENLTGVDLKSQESLNQVNIMHNNMGFGSDIFFTYDGVSLPFDDSSFDIILSQQVLEHVHNVEKYFSESKRVLSSGGKILLEFPHRLVPFDTHTRMWFVHYFPPIVRDIIYDKYRENGSERYNKLLNLHPIWYYKRLLNTMFSFTKDMTGDRIGGFVYRDYYEGNIRIRMMADRLINSLFFGKIIKKILSLFANSTLIIYK
jgi:SAM-dependent methyltransferase